MLRDIVRQLGLHYRFVEPGMNFLLTHGWLRGNLGDYTITLMLVESLKQRLPACSLSLISIPGLRRNADRSRLIKSLDRLIFQDFETDNTELFKKFDAVINLPGGGLQNSGDRRGPFMLRDAEVCHKAGIKHCFASHSFHPSFDLNGLNGNLCVTREPDSFHLLQSSGHQPILAADLAFLLKRPRNTERNMKQTLLFLRFDHFNEISLEGNILCVDDRRIELPDSSPVVTSSDHDRDFPKLRPFVEKHGLRYVKCLDLNSLCTLIESSGCVVSDRYHPVIFAKMAGVEWNFIQRRDCLRDSGLKKLLETKSSSELESMAQSGVEGVAKFLQS